MGRHAARPDKADVARMLAAASVLFREVSRAEADLVMYVSDARDAGASWQAVGEALALPPAEARERFSSGAVAIPRSLQNSIRK